MTEKHQDPLDDLLTQGLVTPPDDFTDRVLKNLQHQIPFDYSQRSKAEPLRRRFWPAAAITASAAVGILQIISFIFGIWIPTVTG